MSSFYPGQRLSTKGQRCTVRYVGQVKSKNGGWLGVEWDDVTRGKHSGTFDGTEYFKCRSAHPTAGSFLRPSAAWDQPKTFLQALKSKYAPIENVDNASSSQMAIRISGKEAEEVGFEKIARQQAQLQNLRVVVLDDLLVKAYDEANTTSEDGLDKILETCPNITDLDLGRNLFESLADVSDICDRLPKLKFLRLDANRLQDVSGRVGSKGPLSGFAQITSASLDHMLCTGKELETFLRHMPNIKELSASSNQLGSVNNCSLPETLTTLTLEDNDLTSLEDFKSVTESCPRLRTLNLKNNKIASTCKSRRRVHFKLPETLTDVDLAYNNISSWNIINELSATFPGLKNLRVAHNPLFNSLSSADGKPLASADGYMLTIARLPQLETLNYSKITDKERLNSESYYLSQIARELSLAPADKETEILLGHPRWNELCQEYGEPKIERHTQHEVDPNSLAARLLECTLYCPSAAKLAHLPDEHNPLVVEIPKASSIYKLYGIIGRRLNVEPIQLRLVLETGEKDRVDMATWSGVEEWDSDEEEAEEVGEEWKEREEELVPGTRSLGTFVDGQKARIRVELRVTPALTD